MWLLMFFLTLVRWLVAEVSRGPAPERGQTGRRIRLIYEALRSREHEYVRIVLRKPEGELLVGREEVDRCVSQ